MPLLAPNLSTITLTTSSSVVQTNGTAEIRATVLESAGTPVQNGTTVTFTTNLGTLSPSEARTTNGVATAQFVANGQSGVAEVRAVSGAAKPADSANPTLKITVGGAAAGRITLSANPARLPSTGGTSQITATVLDTSGNTLGSVPVLFSSTTGTLSSSIATTSAGGQASVSLTTTRDATITASVGSSGTGAVTPATLTVALGLLPSLAFGTLTPASPVEDQAVTIPLTVTTPTGADPFLSVVVNFGDGSSRDLGPLASNTSVAHVYTSDGVFTVTAVGTTASGDRTQAVTQVSVSAKAPLGISVSAAPNPATVNTIVTFTVAFDATAPANVSGYDWTFGDGLTAHTTGKSTQHSYSAVSPAGGYAARVTVSTLDGNSGSAQTQVVVTP